MTLDRMGPWMCTMLMLNRADISLALQKGHRPLLCEEDQLVWDRFMVQEPHCHHDAQIGPVHDLVGGLDPRLRNLWKDLHSFSCLSNLAFQTSHKMAPEIYNEAMISILYRLLIFTHQQDRHEYSIACAVRTSLLVYASTIFMQRDIAHQPNMRIVNDLYDALRSLHPASSTGFSAPPIIILWMILVWHAALRHTDAPDEWLRKWLDDVVSELGIQSWAEARDILRSIMWVGFVHDSVGHRLVGESVQRVTAGVSG